MPYEPRRVCRFPGCVAEGAGEYCTVHRPELIVDRMRVVIKNNFGPFVAGRVHPTREDLDRLRDDILHDLEGIV